MMLKEATDVVKGLRMKCKNASHGKRWFERGAGKGIKGEGISLFNRRESMPRGSGEIIADEVKK